MAGVGVAGAEGCEHGVQRQLPVSAHSRKPASPHGHEHAPMRACTRTPGSSSVSNPMSNINLLGEW